MHEKSPRTLAAGAKLDAIAATECADVSCACARGCNAVSLARFAAHAFTHSACAFAASCACGAVGMTNKVRTPRRATFFGTASLPSCFPFWTILQIRRATRRTRYSPCCAFSGACGVSRSDERAAVCSDGQCDPSSGPFYRYFHKCAGLSHFCGPVGQVSACLAA